MLVHWTRPVPLPPRAGAGTTPETPPEGPAGGAPEKKKKKLPDYVFTRFSVTRAKTYVAFEPCFKRKLVVD